jgi:phosphopantothenoylcysteine decarboxylase
MARLILGVTGSVAAIKVPALAGDLKSAGHELRVVATRPSLYFFEPAELRQGDDDLPELTTDAPLFRDNDEWPGARYHPGGEVLHIEFRRWADIFVVAPLDANTLAKFALGISDNFLTCIFRAWDFTKPVILAPAMNTLMWESPVTLRHLRQLLEDRLHGEPASPMTLASAPAVYAERIPNVVLVPPQAKRLACGDFGLGAMAEVVTIAEVVRHWSERAEA